MGAAGTAVVCAGRHRHTHHSCRACLPELSCPYRCVVVHSRRATSSAASLPTTCSTTSSSSKPHQLSKLSPKPSDSHVALSWHENVPDTASQRPASQTGLSAGRTPW